MSDGQFKQRLLSTRGRGGRHSTRGNGAARANRSSLGDAQQTALQDGQHVTQSGPAKRDGNQSNQHGSAVSSSDGDGNELLLSDARGTSATQFSSAPFHNEKDASSTIPSPVSQSFVQLSSSMTSTQQDVAAPMQQKPHIPQHFQANFPGQYSQHGFPQQQYHHQQGFYPTQHNGMFMQMPHSNMQQQFGIFNPVYQERGAYIPPPFTDPKTMPGRPNTYQNAFNPSAGSFSSQRLPGNILPSHGSNALKANAVPFNAAAAYQQFGLQSDGRDYSYPATPLQNVPGFVPGASNNRSFYAPQPGSGSAGNISPPRPREKQRLAIIDPETGEDVISSLSSKISTTAQQIPPGTSAIETAKTSKKLNDVTIAESEVSDRLTTLSVDNDASKPEVQSVAVDRVEAVTPTTLSANSSTAVNINKSPASTNIPDHGDVDATENVAHSTVVSTTDAMSFSEPVAAVDAVQVKEVATSSVSLSMPVQAAAPTSTSSTLVHNVSALSVSPDAESTTAVQRNLESLHDKPQSVPRTRAKSDNAMINPEEATSMHSTATDINSSQTPSESKDTVSDRPIKYKREELMQFQSLYDQHSLDRDLADELSRNGLLPTDDSPRGSNSFTPSILSSSNRRHEPNDHAFSVRRDRKDERDSVTRDIFGSKSTKVQPRHDDRSSRQVVRGGYRRDREVYVEPLPKSAFHWTGKTSQDEYDVMKRKLFGVLNKLTLDKFNVLSDQFVELVKEGCSSANFGSRMMSDVVQMIFDKALMEAFFSAMYSDLCMKLSAEIPTVPSTESGKDVAFRRLLLNQCQTEFEKSNRSIERGDMSEDNFITAEMTQKRRTLGNIKFICELFKRKMIIEKIIHHSCIVPLFGEITKPIEANIEALCNLLINIGKQLDHEQGRTHMDTYFNRLASLSKSKLLSPRVRFLCLDVIDLRKRNWVARRKVAEAQTLEQVHKEAAGISTVKDAPQDVRATSGKSLQSGRNLPGGLRPPSHDRYAFVRALPGQNVTKVSSPATTAGSATTSNNANASIIANTEDIESDCVRAVRDYLSDPSLSEVLRALPNKQMRHLFVKVCLKIALEHSKHFKPLSELITVLYEKNDLTSKNVTSGIDEFMSWVTADSFADFPKLPMLLGELFASWLILNMITPAVLCNKTKHLRDSGYLAQLAVHVGEALLDACKNETEVRDKLRNISIFNLLPSDPHDAAEFKSKLNRYFG